MTGFWRDIKVGEFILGHPNEDGETVPDITTSGLEVGSSAEFEITIPHQLIGAAEDVGLHCHGRVLRCDADQEHGRTGVACVIERYEFLRSAEAGGK